MISGNCRTCKYWNPHFETEGTCSGASNVDNPWHRPVLSASEPFGLSNGTLFTLHSFGCEQWSEFDHSNPKYEQERKLRRLPMIDKV